MAEAKVVARAAKLKVEREFQAERELPVQERVGIAGNPDIGDPSVLPSPPTCRRRGKVKELAQVPAP